MLTSYTRGQLPNRRANKKALLLTVVGVMILTLAALAVLELTDTTYLLHKRPPEVSASTETKGEPSGADRDLDDTDSPSVQTSNGNQPSGSAPSDSDKSTPSGTTFAILPSDLVSAHKVKPDSSLVSVCNATAGATCTIHFSKDGVRKSLPAEPTDRGGTAYWNGWTPQSIGLTTGAWGIEAVASLNGQEKKLSDALSLEVTQ